MAVNNLNSGVGIQPTIVDAKGDLIAATANDAVNRLAVGTNGQVLVADSGETTGLKWNDPGSVGGLVHIETQAISSGVSAVNFNNVFTTTYDSYYATGFIIHSSGVFDSIIRLRNAGTDRNGNDYDYQSLSLTNTTFNNGAAANSSAILVGQIDNNVGGVFNLWVHNPVAVAVTGIQAEGGAGGKILMSTGGHDNAESHDGFSLISSSGTWASGFISLYGLRK